MIGRRPRLVLFVILAACTCGGRTECGGRAQVNLLTGVHDDTPCRRVSPRGVLLYEATKLLLDAHNNKTGGFKLEVAVMDTCGSMTGALKAAMKALVWADINCLQPPHYLGIIGPDNPTNAEAVQKITSVLKVPHIVRKSSSSPFLHYLAKEDNSYLVQGVLEMIEALKWKSFTLVARADEDGDDDVQNIAKKLTVGAIAKKLCVLVHDEDNDEEDYTSHIVHIGRPVDAFFKGPINSTILILSEGDLVQDLDLINSSNTILLLEDARNDLVGLEAKMEKSRWWTGDQGIGKYDPEELREVRWVQAAIEVYATALDTICKKKKCKNQVNPSDWNDMISKILAVQNQKSLTQPRVLSLSIKSKEGDLKDLGQVVVKKNVAKIHWRRKKSAKKEDKSEEGKDAEDQDEDNEEEEEEEEEDEEEEVSVPDLFRKIVAKGKDLKTGCATALKEAKMLHEEEEPTQVIVSEMDDSEWWTMVGTVSGVGVAMFVVGILAVYIVYTNIRGPRSPKGMAGKSRMVDRDTSLRRVGSDRVVPPSVVVRNQRPHHGPQRRDSNRSISSQISDKSV